MTSQNSDRDTQSKMPIFTYRSTQYQSRESMQREILRLQSALDTSQAMVKEHETNVRFLQRRIDYETIRADEAEFQRKHAEDGLRDLIKYFDTERSQHNEEQQEDQDKQTLHDCVCKLKTVLGIPSALGWDDTPLSVSMLVSRLLCMYRNNEIDFRQFEMDRLQAKLDALIEGIDIIFEDYPSKLKLKPTGDDWTGIFQRIVWLKMHFASCKMRDDRDTWP